MNGDHGRWLLIGQGPGHKGGEPRRQEDNDHRHPHHGENEKELYHDLQLLAFLHVLLAKIPDHQTAGHRCDSEPGHKLRDDYALAGPEEGSVGVGSTVSMLVGISEVVGGKENGIEDKHGPVDSNSHHYVAGKVCPGELQREEYYDRVKPDGGQCLYGGNFVHGQ